MKTLITLILIIFAVSSNAQTDLKMKTLEDKQAIKELQFKYAKALDNQDWELLATIFNDNFTLDFSKWGIPITTMTPKDFTSFMKKTFSTEGLQTQHTMSNFLIEVDNDVATSQIYVLARHKVNNTSVEFFYDMNGYYEQQYVKKDGVWKITSIKLVPRWATGDDPAKIFTF